MTNSEVTNTGAMVAPQEATVALAKGPSQKKASPKKTAPKGRKTAQAAKPKKAKGAQKKAASANTPAAPRGESKGAKILEMIRRAKGATLAEIMQATGWMAHSVRGFISTASKRYGLQIKSSKNDTGHRVYHIAR